MIVAWTTHARAAGWSPLWPEPDSRGSFIEEPIPEDAPQEWREPGVVTYPEARPMVVGLPPVGPSSPYRLTAMNEPVAIPVSSRRSFYTVSQAASEASEPPGDAPEPPDDSPEEEPTVAGSQAPAQAPIGRQPQNNNMQFLRTQDVLLKAGSSQVDTGLWYTLFETQLPVAVVNGGGTVTGVVPGVIRRRLLYSPFGYRYGLTDKVQLFGFLPVGISDTQTSTFGSSLINNSGGVGDLTAGASFHVMEAQDDQPDGIVTLAFTAPTGQYTAPIFGLVPGSALGQGFWAASGSMLFVNRYDPVVVYYGAGYRHLFQRDFGDVKYTAGEQISYQFGVGFSVNDRVTLSTTLQGFYITNTKLDDVTVRGSNLEPIMLRFAATMSRRCKIIEPFAAVGLTQSAPAAWLGITWTYY
jgi:hypothetical protein